jgi:hypothetical protein
MSSEIIHIVAYDNYEFQHLSSIFLLIFISILQGLFIDKINPRVM